MNRKLALASVIAMALAALLVIAIGHPRGAKNQERDTPAKTPSRVSIADGDPVVTIDQATQSRSGIATAALKVVTAPLEEQAYATVLTLQDLADARNSYAAAYAQQQKAQASVEVARQDYRRLAELHDDDRNVSDKVFQAGAAALKIEEANLQAARTSVQSTVNSVAQHYGDVITGWLIHDAPPLKRVLQQQDVLVQVTFPASASNAAPPKSIRLQAGEQQFVAASLVARTPRMDARIQGIGYVYLAPARMLVPGMNIVAYLPIQSVVQAVVVPASAVVWWQGKAWVYVQQRGDRFARREISAEQPVDAGFVAHKGVSPGDRVVLNGAQLLLSEELRPQIQAGDEGDGA